MNLSILDCRGRGRGGGNEINWVNSQNNEIDWDFYPKEIQQSSNLTLVIRIAFGTQDTKTISK